MATFREQLVLLVLERSIAVDVVERSTTRPSLDEVREALNGSRVRFLHRVVDRP